MYVSVYKHIVARSYFTVAAIKETVNLRISVPVAFLMKLIIPSIGIKLGDIFTNEPAQDSWMTSLVQCDTILCRSYSALSWVL